LESPESRACPCCFRERGKKASVRSVPNTEPERDRTDNYKHYEAEKESIVRAIWNGAILAKSDQTIVVEGNHYFPPDSVNRDYFKESDKHTTCPWKGQASYYDVVVEGKVNKDAAWYYPSPKPAAKQIRDHVAFWRGVKIEA
jgi:uncharacterized protein (DUF427 family)